MIEDALCKKQLLIWNICSSQVENKSLHSVSSNRDTLIGTRLVSLEKIGNSSRFDGKYKGQNSLFWGFCGVLCSGTTEIYQKDTIQEVFLDKNKGQVLY